MISNYYVLVALAHEWRSALVGTRISDAYSQSADELSLVFERAAASIGAGAKLPPVHTLRMSTAAPLRYLLLSAGSGRAKRNTASVLESIDGMSVIGLDIVPRDRIMRITFQDDVSLDLVLFGSNANAYVLNPDGVVIDAFQAASKHRGKTLPSRPADAIAGVDDFVGRWRREATGTLGCGQVLGRVVPLFNRFMADEVAIRSGLVPKARASELDDIAVRGLFDGVQALRESFSGATISDESTRGGAWIYWSGTKPERLTLFESVQMDGFRSEVFDSVASAVSVFVRRTLGQKAFAAEHGPVLKKLVTARKRAVKRLADLEAELEAASRSDQYERFGHILMGQPHTTAAPADPFVATDIFDGGEIKIPVDTRLTLIENANRYYEKARTAKLARESAKERLTSAREEAERVTQLADAAGSVETLDDWKQFSTAREEALKPYREAAGRTEPDVPFRRFDLGGGYVVWVGKNARQNEMLSTKASRKFDLWFHARGVPGSHVVLRLPDKNSKPDANVVEAAASIAAYYSKARGGSMVPVIVAEAKFVRKPRGAAPGSVVVDRERVLLVDPGLPGGVGS